MIRYQKNTDAIVFLPTFLFHKKLTRWNRITRRCWAERPYTNNSTWQTNLWTKYLRKTAKAYIENVRIWRTCFPPRQLSKILTNKEMIILFQQPYFPDLVLCDFLLFPRLKYDIRDKRFAVIEKRTCNFMILLNVFKEDNFRRCIQQENERLNNQIGVSTWDSWEDWSWNPTQK